MKRICCITGIFPPDIGGPATYVSRFASALQQHGHAVSVVTLGNTAASGADAAAFPFRVTRISRAYPLPIRLLLLFLTLLREGWNYDLWYIHGLELPAVVAGRLLRKRLVMKIVGDHAWERAMNAGITDDLIDAFQQAPQAPKVEWHKRLRAWHTRQVSQVITPSRYLQQLVCGWGVPKERIQVIYNAVEPLPEALPPPLEVRQDMGFAPADQLLITVARLVPWKGIARILAVLPDLPPSVKFLIAGDGPQKANLQALAEQLELDGRVRFLGKLPRTATLRAMRAADAFVLNTAYEGFSHVLLEAMMVGTPVITTPAGGNPELVTHGVNGLLLPSESPEALRDSISALLSDPELRARLRSNGYATVQKYSWERLLRETMMALYDTP